MRVSRYVRERRVVLGEVGEACDDPGELAAALGFVQFVGERCLRLCHSGAAFAARQKHARWRSRSGRQTDAAVLSRTGATKRPGARRAASSAR